MVRLEIKSLGLSTDNISKPQNKKWKFISKFLTRTLPVYAAAAVALPISEKWKVAIIFIQTILVATISAISELTIEKPKIEEPVNTPISIGDGNIL